jgi:signal transduction histidine kinase
MSAPSTAKAALPNAAATSQEALTPLLEASVFPEPLEREFVQQQRRALELDKTSFVTILVVHLCFLPIDWLCFEQHRAEAVALRLMCSLVPTLVAFGLSFSAFGRRNIETLRLLTFVLGSLGLTLMLLVAEPSEIAFESYVWGYGAFFVGLVLHAGLPFRGLVVVVLLAWLEYQVVYGYRIWTAQLVWQQYVFSQMMQLSFIATTLTAISELQRRQRRDFLTKKIIEAERRHIEQQHEELQRIAEELHAAQLENALLQGIEGERQRVALDLHDSLGQMLAVTKLTLTDALDRSNVHDARTQLERGLRALDGALLELRAITRNLSPIGLYDMGLYAALHELFQTYPAKMTVTLHYEVTVRLTQPQTITLYALCRRFFTTPSSTQEARNCSSKCGTTTKNSS